MYNTKYMFQFIESLLITLYRRKKEDKRKKLYYLNIRMKRFNEFSELKFEVNTGLLMGVLSIL